MTRPRDTRMPELQRPPWVWAWAIVATGALGLFAIYGAWDGIPDPFPTHWNARGEADSFSEKTWGNMILMFGLLSGILAIVAAGSFALIHQTAKHQRGEDWKIARARAMSNSMLKPLGMWMFLLNAVIVFDIYLSITQVYSSFALLIAVIIIVVIGLMWNVVHIQKWLDEHYPDPKTSKHMKWGIFYYNPDDPNMMVHRELNSTFNMAHPGSWVAMGALIGMPIILVAVLIILGL